MKSIFSQRLQSARKQAGFRALKDFADAIDESVATCTSWEHRGSEPRYETLSKICTALNVSADYLLGLTEAPQAGITQLANHSPHTTQTANNCPNCPFAESYRKMAEALTAIALKGAQ